jgi:hypothetical protein
MVHVEHLVSSQGLTYLVRTNFFDKYKHQPPRCFVPPNTRFSEVYSPESVTAKYGLFVREGAPISTPTLYGETNDY